MIVHFARLGESIFEDAPCIEFEKLSSLDRFNRHQIGADPHSADLIIFPQCHMLGSDWRLRAITEHRLTRLHKKKVTVYDERDRPWCSLPGVYVSMPSTSFNVRFQRSWAYYGRLESTPDCDPDLLFSFIASPTASCREPLFRLAHPDAIVEKVRRFTFYDSTSLDFEARRFRFRSILARSRFVLCPRGRGTSSIRLYETLAAGRVPVIISDDSVPPPGPDWNQICIRWPEGATGGLIEMIQAHDHEWAKMSTAARSAYREHFAPDSNFHHIVSACGELLAADAGIQFPPDGLRNRAFFGAGWSVVHGRMLTTARRSGRRVLNALHSVIAKGRSVE